MNRQLVARVLASVMALAGTTVCFVHPALQLNVMATATPQSSRSTLKVGMWTLWHDREVVLTPGDSQSRPLMRSCESCAPETLRAPATIRADGERVVATIGAKTLRWDGVWLSGAVTLGAHGEDVTLRNPVRISGRGGVLCIVVILPVESYVERVVASESGPADSAESLKALAIVVRSFALHEAHGHTDYDLCDSTHCQLLHWHGSAERAGAAHAATLATAGETLWFKDQRALAYFGKDCGGRTASPEEIWPHARKVPYLSSQADRFCTGDGGREWASEVTRAELTAALATHGVTAPGWHNLVVAQRGESGRAGTLRLDGNEVSAEAFRLAVGESLGWNRIPSTWFEVNQQGERFFFHGHGWGHGVGLCQKGSAAMAAQGRLAQQILEQYFPGAKAADEESGRTWKSFVGEGFVLESIDSADANYLSDLNRAREEASQRSGLNASEPFTVRAFASTPAFRQATLTPGWVAAFTERDWIGVQPFRTLAARKLLAGTMRHEFLHALVEHQAGPRAPLWLREGLAEVWSEGDEPANRTRAQRHEAAPSLKLDAIDVALAHAATEAESEAAHHAAAWYAEQLRTRYGRAQVLEWLRSGVPDNVVAGLGQR